MWVSHLGREFVTLSVLLYGRPLATTDYRCMRTRQALTASLTLAQRVARSGKVVATVPRGGLVACLPAAPAPRAAVALEVRLDGTPRGPGHRASSRGSRSWDLAAAGREAQLGMQAASNGSRWPSRPYPQLPRTCGRSSSWVKNQVDPGPLQLPVVPLAESDTVGPAQRAQLQ